MSGPTLPSTMYSSAQARMKERNTVIEDAPQVSIRRAPPQKPVPRQRITSPMTEDFPTPRAHIYAAIDEEPRPRSSASSDADSEYSLTLSRRSTRSGFDELYDVTESESEGEVPIKLSMSVKRRQMGSHHNRLPSLVIPSPSEWPTHDKMKSAVTPLSPPIRINLAPGVLEQLQANSTPSSSAAPSLDGSFTDEELAMSSCPSTPDISQHDDEDQPWELPIQLDPSSISLLQHITGEDDDNMLETVIEVPEEAISEMREIVESPPLTARMRLETQNLVRADPEDELSALSVPSPGVFFASLNSSVARQNWSGFEQGPTTSIATEFYDVPFRSSAPSALPTSTATRFYDLPWQQRPENPIEHTVSAPFAEARAEPITARRIPFSPTEQTIEESIEEVEEMNEGYNTALQEAGAATNDRTQLWLSSQADYMQALLTDDAEVDGLDAFADIEDVVPKTPEDVSPLATEISLSKKSVRFADNDLAEVESKTEVEKKRVSPIHDGTFWDGWRHIKRSQRARDVFQHRQARAEAEHVKRVSGEKQHVEQLQGKYEIVEVSRPASQRPISKLIPAPAEDDKQRVIACAERERQALEQMQFSAWHISAQKEMTGGKLLTSPIVQSFKGRKDVRILDLAGQVHCSWAWDVAMEHPAATVYTTVTTDAEAHVAASSLDGPSNHVVTAAPKTWELPFEDKYFDVISARNLYTFLKITNPKGETADEWDLTLRECLRCLKPGGYLEYDLLDAELVHPEPAAQALGVEFSFNLKTRGYDPSSGKTFLPRLKRAGFSSIKRAWMVLPVADVAPRWTDKGKEAANDTAEKSIAANGDVVSYQPPVTGSTRDVRAITGLVGGRMWEQWILKMNSEMGHGDVDCVEGVARALQEGGKGNTGFRCLVGWARREL